MSLRARTELRVRLTGSELGRGDRLAHNEGLCVGILMWLGGPGMQAGLAGVARVLVGHWDRARPERLRKFPTFDQAGPWF